MWGLLCLIFNLNPIYNKGRLGWQPKPNQHQTLVVHDIMAPLVKNKLQTISNSNPIRDILPIFGGYK